MTHSPTEPARASSPATNGATTATALTAEVGEVAAAYEDGRRGSRHALSVHARQQTLCVLTTAAAAAVGTNTAVAFSQSESSTPRTSSRVFMPVAEPSLLGFEAQRSPSSLPPPLAPPSSSQQSPQSEALNLTLESDSSSAPVRDSVSPPMFKPVPTLLTSAWFAARKHMPATSIGTSNAHTRAASDVAATTLGRNLTSDALPTLTTISPIPRATSASPYAHLIATHDPAEQLLPIVREIDQRTTTTLMSLPSRSHTILTEYRSIADASNHSGDLIIAYRRLLAAAGDTPAQADEKIRLITASRVFCQRSPLSPSTLNSPLPPEVEEVIRTRSPSPTVRFDDSVNHCIRIINTESNATLYQYDVGAAEAARAQARGGYSPASRRAYPSLTREASAPQTATAAIDDKTTPKRSIFKRRRKTKEKKTTTIARDENAPLASLAYDAGLPPLPIRCYSALYHSGQSGRSSRLSEYEKHIGDDEIVVKPDTASYPQMSTSDGSKIERLEKSDELAPENMRQHVRAYAYKSPLTEVDDALPTKQKAILHMRSQRNEVRDKSPPLITIAPKTLRIDDPAADAESLDRRRQMSIEALASHSSEMPQYDAASMSERELKYRVYVRERPPSPRKEDALKKLDVEGAFEVRLPKDAAEGTVDEAKVAWDVTQSVATERKPALPKQTALIHLRRAEPAALQVAPKQGRTYEKMLPQRYDGPLEVLTRKKDLAHSIFSMPPQPNVSAPKSTARFYVTSREESTLSLPELKNDAGIREAVDVASLSSSSKKQVEAPKASARLHVVTHQAEVEPSTIRADPEETSTPRPKTPKREELSSKTSSSPPLPLRETKKSTAILHLREAPALDEHQDYVQDAAVVLPSSANLPNVAELESPQEAKTTARLHLMTREHEAKTLPAPDASDVPLPTSSIKKLEQKPFETPKHSAVLHVKSHPQDDNLSESSLGIKTDTRAERKAERSAEPTSAEQTAHLHIQTQTRTSFDDEHQSHSQTLSPVVSSSTSKGERRDESEDVDAPASEKLTARLHMHSAAQKPEFGSITSAHDNEILPDAAPLAILLRRNELADTHIKEHVSAYHSGESIKAKTSPKAKASSEAAASTPEPSIRKTVALISVRSQDDGDEAPQTNVQPMSKEANVENLEALAAAAPTTIERANEAQLSQPAPRSLRIFTQERPVTPIDENDKTAYELDVTVVYDGSFDAGHRSEELKTAPLKPSDDPLLASSMAPQKSTARVFMKSNEQPAAEALLASSSPAYPRDETSFKGAVQSVARSQDVEHHPVGWTKSDAKTLTAAQKSTARFYLSPSTIPTSAVALQTIEKRAYPRDAQPYEGPLDVVARSVEVPLDPLNAHVELVAQPLSAARIDDKRIHYRIVMRQKPSDAIDESDARVLRASSSPPLEELYRRVDVDVTPLRQHTNVYHSGVSAKRRPFWQRPRSTTVDTPTKAAPVQKSVAVLHLASSDPSEAAIEMRAQEDVPRPQETIKQVAEEPTHKTVARLHLASQSSQDEPETRKTAKKTSPPPAAAETSAEMLERMPKSVALLHIASARDKLITEEHDAAQPLLLPEAPAERVEESARKSTALLHISSGDRTSPAHEKPLDISSKSAEASRAQKVEEPSAQYEAKDVDAPKKTAILHVRASSAAPFDVSDAATITRRVHEASPGAKSLQISEPDTAHVHQKLAILHIKSPTEETTDEPSPLAAKMRKTKGRKIGAEKYPPAAPYDGSLQNLTRTKEIPSVALSEQVEVLLATSRSLHVYTKAPEEPEQKPRELSFDYPIDFAPRDVPLEDMQRTQDFVTLPLAAQVNAYHSGVYERMYKIRDGSRRKRRVELNIEMPKYSATLHVKSPSPHESEASSSNEKSVEFDAPLMQQNLKKRVPQDEPELKYTVYTRQPREAVDALKVDTTIDPLAFALVSERSPPRESALVDETSELAVIAERSERERPKMHALLHVRSSVPNEEESTSSEAKSAKNRRRQKARESAIEATRAVEQPTEEMDKEKKIATNAAKLQEATSIEESPDERESRYRVYVRDNRTDETMPIAHSSISTSPAPLFDDPVAASDFAPAAPLEPAPSAIDVSQEGADFSAERRKQTAILTMSTAQAMSAPIEEEKPSPVKKQSTTAASAYPRDAEPYSGQLDSLVRAGVFQDEDLKAHVAPYYDASSQSAPSRPTLVGHLLMRKSSDEASAPPLSSFEEMNARFASAPQYELCLSPEFASSPLEVERDEISNADIARMHNEAIARMAELKNELENEEHAAKPTAMLFVKASPSSETSQTASALPAQPLSSSSQDSGVSLIVDEFGTKTRVIDAATSPPPPQQKMRIYTQRTTSEEVEARAIKMPTTCDVAIILHGGLLNRLERQIDADEAPLVEHVTLYKPARYPRSGGAAKSRQRQSKIEFELSPPEKLTARLHLRAAHDEEPQQLDENSAPSASLEEAESAAAATAPTKKRSRSYLRHFKRHRTTLVQPEKSKSASPTIAQEEAALVEPSPKRIARLLVRTRPDDDANNVQRAADVYSAKAAAKTRKQKTRSDVDIVAQAQQQHEVAYAALMMIGDKAHFTTERLPSELSVDLHLVQRARASYDVQVLCRDARTAVYPVLFGGRRGPVFLPRSLVDEHDVAYQRVSRTLRPSRAPTNSNISKTKSDVRSENQSAAAAYRVFTRPSSSVTTSLATASAQVHK